MACCKACKIGAMKKHHKVKKHHRRRRVGAMDGMMGDVLETSLPGVGMIVAHEVKGMLPASWGTSMGANYPYIVNGIGFLAGVGIPMLIKDPKTKMYVKPLAAGIAGQCLYSLFVQKVLGQSPPVINRTWNTYGLGKPSTYSLGCTSMPNGMMPNLSDGGTMNLNPGSTSNPASVNPAPAAIVKTLTPNNMAAGKVAGPRRSVGGF